MEQLTAEQETRVEQFSAWLGDVVGPEDLFPPDETATREPMPEPTPKLPPLRESIGETALRLAIENDSPVLVAA